MRNNGATGCFLGYVSQTDPNGKLPPWLVNKCTQIFGPKLVKKLYKAAVNYPIWKSAQQKPSFKPWYFPEQMICPRITISDCILPKGCPCDEESQNDLEM